MHFALEFLYLEGSGGGNRNGRREQAREFEPFLFCSAEPVTEFPEPLFSHLQNRNNTTT